MKRHGWKLCILILLLFLIRGQEHAQVSGNPACTSFRDSGQVLPAGLYRICSVNNEFVVDQNTAAGNNFTSYNRYILAGNGTPFCNVQFHGAKGDGATDDSVAFIACRMIVEAFASSGIIYTPPSANPYCVKNTLTLLAENTWLQGAGQGVNLSSCGSGKTVLEMSNGGEKLTDISLTGPGMDGEAGFGATQSTLVIDSNCVDCIFRDLTILGGLHSVQWNSREANMDTVTAFGAYGSAIMYFAGTGGNVAAGHIFHVKPDQPEYPFGTPAQGTTFGNWTANHLYGSVGTVVSVTCQDANLYYIQLKTAGTSGGSAPTCKNYNVDIPDGSAVWQLNFPNPYYHWQFDTGTSEAYVFESDTGGGYAGWAMTNTLSGTPPTLVGCIRCNGGGGYQANFWGHDGSNAHFIEVNTGGCLFLNCSNYLFNTNFSGIVTITGGKSSSSYYDLSINTGNHYNVSNGMMDSSLNASISVSNSVTDVGISNMDLTGGAEGVSIKGSADHVRAIGNWTNNSNPIVCNSSSGTNNLISGNDGNVTYSGCN